MSLFTHDADFSQLEWKLLRDSFLNFYILESSLDKDLALLKKKKYRVIEFDCNSWNSQSDIDNEFFKLGIPYDNCSNLNALKDCITELNLSDMSDAVIVLKSFDNLIKIVNKDYAEGFLDILASEARKYLLFGIRLVILISAHQDIEFFGKYGGSPLIKRN